jgi:hypothetical protein
MITDLFVVTSGLDAGTVARAIPPACRREASARPVATVRQDELLLEFGEWRPRVPARHLVPSFSMLTEGPTPPASSCRRGRAGRGHHGSPA